MQIYIASSWRNQHAVEMLTSQLRQNGHTVVSWVENCPKQLDKNFNELEWMKTIEAEDAFVFDTNGATQCDLFIYLSPGGQDASAELGAAWANSIPILGLFAKGENLGLMRKMVTKWYDRHAELLKAIALLEYSNRFGEKGKPASYRISELP